MHIRLVSLSVAVLLLVTLGLSPAGAQTPNPYLNAGMRLYTDFEYESALEQLKKAAAFPGNSVTQDVQIAIFLGLIRYELGDPAGAEADFKTALALDPTAQPPGSMSPKVAASFERAREDILKTRPRPATTAATAPVKKSPEPTQVVTVTRPPAPVPADAPLRPVTAVTPATVDPAPALGLTPAAPAPAPELRGQKKGGNTLVSMLLIGAGAALGGGGAYFGMQSSGSVDSARAESFQSDAVGRLDDARSQALTANLMYGAAGAAVIAGVIALIAGGGSDDAAVLASSDD